MLINGKNYIMPELNFNTMCRLEEMGVTLSDMDQKVLSTVRGFLALAIGGDLEKAGQELEAHLSKGGSLDQMLREINQAVENSGFFQGLVKSKTKSNGTGQKKKTEAEAQNINLSGR